MKEVEHGAGLTAVPIPSKRNDAEVAGRDSGRQGNCLLEGHKSLGQSYSVNQPVTSMPETVVTFDPSDMVIRSLASDEVESSMS